MTWRKSDYYSGDPDGGMKRTASGDFQTMWKLKGTDKNGRPHTLAACEAGQPVFVVCNSNGSNCTVVTGRGEELGGLKKKDAQLFHQFVENRRARFFIRSITGDPGKPKVYVRVLIPKSELKLFD